MKQDFDPVIMPYNYQTTQECYQDKAQKNQIYLTPQCKWMPHDENPEKRISVKMAVKTRLLQKPGFYHISTGTCPASWP